MRLRQLMNVCYAALAASAEDVDALDRELETHPEAVGVGRSTGDVRALMSAGQMGGRRP